LAPQFGFALPYAFHRALGSGRIQHFIWANVKNLRQTTLDLEIGKADSRAGAKKRFVRKSDSKLPVSLVKLASGLYTSSIGNKKAISPGHFCDMGPAFLSKTWPAQKFTFTPQIKGRWGMDESF